MRQCPYCGRWFKNRYSLMSHLKYCPAKNGVILSKRFSNEIKEIEFDSLGYHWYIKGRKGFTDILNKIYKISKKQGWGDLIIVARSFRRS